MSEKNEICERIRTLRISKKITQEALGFALDAGTPQSAKAMIAKIEAGQVPGGIRLQKLAGALGCSLDFLLTGNSQDLMELIRFYLPSPEHLAAPSRQVFRCARLFLYFALACEHTPSKNEFSEVANRLFYLAECAPDICEQLLASFPQEIQESESVSQAKIPASLSDLINQLWHQAEQTQDLKTYADYRRAEEWATHIRQHHIMPPTPPIPASSPSAASAWSPEQNPPELRGQRIAVIQIPDDSLEPLAHKDQYAILAEPSRIPQEGDLVACHTSESDVHFGRFFPTADAVHIIPLSPEKKEIVHLARDICEDIRVVRGVLFE